MPIQQIENRPSTDKHLPATPVRGEAAKACPAEFVGVAEAALIAGLARSEMHRLVDEQVLPPSLFRIARNGDWQFARLGAALAGFYFGTEQLLSPALRQQALVELEARTGKRLDRDRVLDLAINPRDLNWQISVPNALVDASSFVIEAWQRVRRIERARVLVAAHARTRSIESLYVRGVAGIGAAVAGAEAQPVSEELAEARWICSAIQ